jgi:hypothetical protein
MAKEDSAKISLDDVIAAAGQGAMRALNATQLSATTNNDVFIELYIRCGMPAHSAHVSSVVEPDSFRSGSRPLGPRDPS